MSEREQIPSGLRAFVLHRDKYTCQYCGAKSLRVDLHVDHIIPVSHGGKNNFGNLVTACSPCNIGKSNNFLKPRKNTVLDSIKSFLFLHVKIMDVDEYLMLKSIQSGLMDGTIIIPKKKQIVLRSPVDENGESKIIAQHIEHEEPVKTHHYRDGRFGDLMIILGALMFSISATLLVMGF